jgi:hypothetical protein
MEENDAGIGRGAENSFQLFLYMQMDLEARHVRHLRRIRRAFRSSVAISMSAALISAMILFFSISIPF